MARLRLRFLLIAVLLWAALLLPALPADASELGGESKHYAASARLADGVLHIAIVDKASGRKVSNRVPTRGSAGDGRTLHVRKATRAETDQKAIYDALGIDPAPGGVRKMIV